jgi:hypothetical protein
MEVVNLEIRLWLKALSLSESHDFICFMELIIMKS